MFKIARSITYVILALVLLFTAAIIVLTLINLGRPTNSAVTDRLSDEEQARLAEFFHAREALGDAVWPGWGAADIPVIVYNESYAFLIGLPDPAGGWVKVPENQALGGPWEPVDGVIDGRPVYRQALAAPDENPEAFTVRVGERWVASLPTMEWLRIGLTNQIHDELPPVVNLAFPYGLFVNQAVSSSDHYISMVGHEAFHAFQGAVAPERLAAAEAATHREADYAWDDETLEAAWQAELDYLQAAISAPADEAGDMAREFLRLRAERREAVGLPASQIDYERQREWLEGLAFYTELALWREAWAAVDYRPSAAVLSDREFDGYSAYEQRESREIGQISRMAGDVGDGRFYYSGYAQAVLLDRLSPGWKNRAFEPGAFLEDLLAQALDGQ